MTGDPAYTRQAVDAMTVAVDSEHDFSGWLADVLARVAAEVGGSGVILAGRPGSWESALVRQLLAGTVGEDDEYLPDPGKDRTMSDPAEEAERRRRMHDLERGIARQPEQPGPDRPDPIHVLKIRLHDDPPGVARYHLARWSLIAHLVRDAEGSGDKARRSRQGCDADLPGRPARRVRHGRAAAGRRRAGDRWLRWLPPWPVEPVPGSPQDRGQHN